MTEVAGVVAALAAVGALFFAWRTVVVARAARAEDERDRRLNRIALLAVALTEMAADIDGGAIGRARITQARARVLWGAAGAQYGEDVRAAVVNELPTYPEVAEAAAEARAAVGTLLIGLGGYLAAE